MKSTKKGGKKSMKSMKASMRRVRKAKRVSTKGKKYQVWNGTRLSTIGGLKKSDLMKNKHGKVVSKKMHAKGKKLQGKSKKWMTCVISARRAMGIKGFCCVGGKSKAGQALLTRARSMYRK
jgi:hypothetical protein